MLRRAEEEAEREVAGGVAALRARLAAGAREELRALVAVDVRALAREFDTDLDALGAALREEGAVAAGEARAREEAEAEEEAGGVLGEEGAEAAREAAEEVRAPQLTQSDSFFLVD